MQPSPISPLAQKIAESYEVDLAEVQASGPEGTITARNVLDFLNLTADEEAAVRRRAERKAGYEEVAVVERDAESNPGEAEIENTLENVGESQASGTPSGPTPRGDSANGYAGAGMKLRVTKAEAQVLNQTKAQLQATAMVHQKALMQVGALRHERLEGHQRIRLTQRADHPMPGAQCSVCQGKAQTAADAGNQKGLDAHWEVYLCSYERAQPSSRTALPPWPDVSGSCLFLSMANTLRALTALPAGACPAHNGAFARFPR